jgi:dimethylamine/trimethylamine dehydrogenase
MSYGIEHVAVATGAVWRRDGVGRYHTLPFVIGEAIPVLTPDDLMAGERPRGHVIIYDDDHYYMGGVLAELLVGYGNRVTIVTPAGRVSEWTYNTLEQWFIQRRLLESGVDIIASHALMNVEPGAVEIACIYSGRLRPIDCDSVVLVTSRLPDDRLYLDLKSRQDAWHEAGIRSVKAIGDAMAPAAIAWATYAGHRYAEELDQHIDPDALPFRREVAMPKTIAE